MDKQTCPNCHWEPTEWQDLNEFEQLGYCSYPLPSFMPRRPITNHRPTGTCTYTVNIDGYATPCYIEPCPCFTIKTPIEEEGTSNV